MKCFPYPITTRILDHYIEVGCPDFRIYRAKRRFDDLKSAEEIGMLILEVMKEVNLKIEENIFHKKSNPAASKPRGSINPDQALGERFLKMKEVQVKLGNISHETVRRLCARGKLNPVLTDGGHRRFRESEIDRYRRDVEDITCNPAKGI